MTDRVLAIVAIVFILLDAICLCAAIYFDRLDE